MALGTTTIVEQVAGEGPVFIDRVTQVGDGAYPAGGTAAFQAKYRAAAVASGLKKASGRNIIAILPGGLNPDDGSGTSKEIVPLYDHTSDKLMMVLMNTGVESAQSNQSSVTYNLLVLSY